MPVTADQPAPYAPASAIIALVERYRSKGLPVPIDSDVLARAGVSESLIPRTLQALQTLDLITDDGKPTAVLEGIRLAPEADYQQRLSDWLHAAYADALQFIDPAVASETDIRDAFRSYKPFGQQDRMVSLFSGLFAAAGVAPERAKTPAPKKLVLRKPTAQAPRGSAPKPLTSNLKAVAPSAFANTGVPPAISGLLASLPDPNDGWTRDDRDRFYTTFGAVLDFCFPIRAVPKQKVQSPEYEEGDQM